MSLLSTCFYGSTYLFETPKAPHHVWGQGENCNFPHDPRFLRKSLIFLYFLDWSLGSPGCQEEALGVQGSDCSPAVISAVLCKSARTSCGNMKCWISLRMYIVHWKWMLLNQTYSISAHSWIWLTSPNVLAPFGSDIGLSVGSSTENPENQRWIYWKIQTKIRLYQ